MWSTSAILAALAAFGISGTMAAAFFAFAGGASGGGFFGGFAVPNPNVGAGLPLLAAVIAYAVYRSVASRRILARDAGK